MNGDARDRLRSVTDALRLQWSCAPVRCAIATACNLLAGMVPAIAAWLLRGLISNLELGAAGAGTARMLWALGAALTAGGFGLMLELTHDLQTTLKQRVSLAVNQALFGKVNRLPGLAHFEDPRFHTQLVLAESAAAEAPQLLRSW